MRHPKRGNTTSIKVPKRLTDSIIQDLLEALPPASDGFKAAYLREEILSKYVGPDTDPADVRRDRAIEKWLDAERRNAKTNARVMLIDVDDEYQPQLGWCHIQDLITEIRNTVARILGPLDYDKVFRTFSHTNGASVRVRRSPVAACHKLEGEAHVSVSALTHWLRINLLSKEQLITDNQKLAIQESSALFTVPKRADIDRVACKEPEINMLLQRSAGSYIRKRLKRHGVDLNDQTVNQQWAMKALNYRLATIDLSSASDSITTSLVLQLLPWEWYSLLDDLRVKSTVLPDGRQVELEMFSSMGNGFTFELESLLFYAITRTVCRLSGVKGRISVYGDDIIAPSAIVPRLARVLHFLGFKMNPKKTHYKGYFRESCGKHYYRGHDVTPFYIRKDVSTLPELIRLLNRVMEWDSRGVGFISDPKILHFHRKYSAFVPQKFWGGVDPADISCLVTGHAPRYRLTPVRKEVPYNDESAFVHWLMQREDSNTPIAIDPSREVAYKATRVSRGWLTVWRPWFIEPKDL